MVTMQAPTRRETSRPSACDPAVNVGGSERWASGVAGGLLALYGLSRGSLFGLGLAAVGGGLLYRGVTGHCYGYGVLGVNTCRRRAPATSVPAARGMKIERSVTVNKPVSEVFRFWRRFENLPRFMDHLRSVTTNGNRSHWVAKAPLGFEVSWDAEIVNEEQDRLIAWRSLPGSTVDNAGSVHFTPAPGGRGTEVRVALKYDPPAGRLGAAVAWMFGEEPGMQVTDDLRRFKQIMETGELAASETPAMPLNRM